jgi:hypothetical protein
MNRRGILFGGLDAAMLDAACRADALIIGMPSPETDFAILRAIRPTLA